MNQREQTGFAGIDARASEAIEPVQDAPLLKAKTTHVGKSLERFEDPAILTGRGRYGDDLGIKPGTLHAAVLRSPHAHAELISINTTGALACEGVRAVLTRDDLAAWSRPFVVGVKSKMEQWALATDRVRYVGEPVAVVMAESRALAEDALDLIKVEYKTLDPVTSIEGALKSDAAVLHPNVETNVISDRSFRYGEPETAFRDAPHRVKLEAHYPRNTCAPIECAVVIAEYLSGDEGYDVTSNFMGPFSLHAVMALALNVPANRLRHKAPRDSGGSFGVKQAVFPYVVLMCLASRKANAPVKYVEDRLEHLSAATSATGRRTGTRSMTGSGGGGTSSGSSGGDSATGAVTGRAAPPSIGTACVPIRAGSLPTSGSVSRKALIS